jgi:hypothetical protein
MTPPNSTYQPTKPAMTSSVGPGQIHTAAPTPASSRPRAIDQLRAAGSIGTLNIMKVPRKMRSALRTKARSSTIQSVARMMPPATTLAMPMTNGTHQRRLAASTSCRTIERGLRRQDRRVDAREQLRLAHGQLTELGMDAFAERARRELMATRPTRRSAPNSSSVHAPSNGISGKVFTKLGIGSRKELGAALSDTGAAVLLA